MLVWSEIALRRAPEQKPLSVNNESSIFNFKFLVSFACNYWAFVQSKCPVEIKADPHTIRTSTGDAKQSELFEQFSP